MYRGQGGIEEDAMIPQMAAALGLRGAPGACNIYLIENINFIYDIIFCSVHNAPRMGRTRNG